LKGRTWLISLRVDPALGFCECCNEVLGCIKSQAFLDQLTCHVCSYSVKLVSNTVHFGIFSYEINKIKLVIMIHQCKILGLYAGN
jgi:hypothetical protein